MKSMRRISRGSGFGGVMKYVFERDKNERALGAEPGRLIGGNMSGFDPASLTKEFNAVRNLRPDIAKPVWHNALRMPAGEDISDEKWQEIGAEYLQKMGFDLQNTQWAMVKHDDEGAVHIVANRIGLDGQVYLGKNENLRSTKVCGELEHTHNLTITKCPDIDEQGKLVMPDRKILTKGEIDMGVRTGEKPPRLVISETLDTVLADHPNTKTFVERLEAVGITAIPNIASTGRMNGFSFSYDGVAFPASKIGDSYKWQNLQKGIDYEQTRDSAFLAERLSQHRNRTGIDATADRAVEVDPQHRQPDGGLGQVVERDRAAVPSASSVIGRDFVEFAGNELEGSRSSRGISEANKGNAGVLDKREANSGGVLSELRNFGEQSRGLPDKSLEFAGGNQNLYRQERGETPRGQEIRKQDDVVRLDSLERIHDLAAFPLKIDGKQPKDQLAKEQAWEKQDTALQAGFYRLTVKSRKATGENVAKNLGKGLGDDIDPKTGEKTERLWSANEVRTKIPELRRWNAAGFDIYITPDPKEQKSHFFLIDDATDENLSKMKGKGFEPCLIQQSSVGNKQAIMRTPVVPSAFEKEAANDLFRSLNKDYGDPNIRAKVHAFRMAGFSNKKPGRGDVFTQVLETKPGHDCPELAQWMTGMRERSESQHRISLDCSTSEIRREHKNILAPSNLSSYQDRNTRFEQERDALKAASADYCKRTGKDTPTGCDESWLDYVAGCRMAQSGYKPEDVQAAIKEAPYARSKGIHGAAYADRTAANIERNGEVVEARIEQRQQEKQAELQKQVHSERSKTTSKGLER